MIIAIDAINGTFIRIVNFITPTTTESKVDSCRIKFLELRLILFSITCLSWSRVSALDTPPLRCPCCQWCPCCPNSLSCRWLTLQLLFIQLNYDSHVQKNIYEYVNGKVNLPVKIIWCWAITMIDQIILSRLKLRLTVLQLTATDVACTIN